MKNTKKILALFLIIALSFSLFACAKTSKTDDVKRAETEETQGTNLFQVSALTVIADENDTVTIEFATTNDWENPIAFDTDSPGVSANWVADSYFDQTSLPLSISYVDAPGGTGGSAGYYGQIVLNIVDAEPSVSSIALDMADSYTLNFTVAIDKNEAECVTNITTYIYNGTNNTVVADPTLLTTVEAPTETHSQLSQYPADGLQYWPNAASTLDALSTLEVGTPPTAVISGYDYANGNLNSIAGIEKAYPDGWLYGVYRGGNLLPFSAVVNSSVFPLEDGDYVFWFFGPWASLPSEWENNSNGVVDLYPPAK